MWQKDGGREELGAKMGVRLEMVAVYAARKRHLLLMEVRIYW